MRMWILVLVLCIAAYAQAAEPNHLKPGALVGQLGRVTLVEEVLWVEYPYATLRSIPPRLRKVATELDSALAQLRTEAYRNANSTHWDDPLSLLKLYTSRFEYVNETVSLALETYIGLDGPARSKRAWLEGVGRLSHDLFGTAMDSDVQELRFRFNELTSIASTNNRAVQINCQRLAKLDRHVKDLGLYVNRLKLSMDNIFETLDSMYHYMVFNQALPALENAVNGLLHANQQIITNLVDATNGRVTPTLIPVKDFEYALEVGKKEYGLHPLFDLRGIQHYYAVASSLVTTDSIVIHIPFKSGDVLDVHQVEPFPFLANDTLMVLDLPPSIVVISTDFTLYATASVAELQRCKTSTIEHFYCPASLFAFLTITGGVCEVVLTQADATKALELCPYTSLSQESLFHKTFFHHHYFLFSSPMYISIICPDGTQYKEVSGHLAIYFSCNVRSSNLTTFPSNLHKGFIGNSSARIYPLSSLDNIHLSNIKNVNNKVLEFKFSNTSDLDTPIHEILPTYLHPHVHYPSFIIPIVIILIVLIPLGCYLKRALTLYNILRNKRGVTVSSQQDSNV